MDCIIQFPILSRLFQNLHLEPLWRRSCLLDQEEELLAQTRLFQPKRWTSRTGRGAKIMTPWRLLQRGERKVGIRKPINCLKAILTAHQRDHQGIMMLWLNVVYLLVQFEVTTLKWYVNGNCWLPHTVFSYFYSSYAELHWHSSVLNLCNYWYVIIFFL